MHRLILMTVVAFVGCGAPTPSSLVSRATRALTGADCKLATGAGTTHSTNITAAETWKASDGPHRVTTSLRVDATLTIEACTQVIVSDGVSIAVGSSSSAGAKLITQGRFTDAKGLDPEKLEPVIFTSEDGKRWGSLQVWAKSEAQLSVTVLNRGGHANAYFDSQATLVGRGPNDGTMSPLITAKLVFVVDSGGVGVALRAGAGFGPSDGLVVLGTGKAAPPQSGDYAYVYPVLIEPPGLGTLPAGLYRASEGDTATESDRVLVLAGTVAGDEQIHDRGLPYRMLGELYLRPATTSTFTIHRGVQLRFVKRSSGAVVSLAVGDWSALDPRLVTLNARGTAEKPILFTSDSATPAAGDWVGLRLDGSPAAGNVLHHARVEYAGGESGANSFGCGPRDNDSAILITEWRPDDAFIQNVTISNSAGGGIVCGWASNAAGPDLKQGNTFTNIANACDVARARTLEVNYCPGRTETSPLCL